MVVRLKRNYDFYKALLDYPIVIIHFGADWLRCSQELQPKFSSLADQHQDWLFAEADFESEVAREMGGESWHHPGFPPPSFCIFRKNEILASCMGPDFEQLKKLIAALKTPN